MLYFCASKLYHNGINNFQRYQKVLAFLPDLSSDLPVYARFCQRVVLGRYAFYAYLSGFGYAGGLVNGFQFFQPSRSIFSYFTCTSLASSAW